MIGQEAIGHWDQVWAEMEMAVKDFSKELWTRELCGDRGWSSAPDLNCV